jgi:type II secretory pathway predicted ATPase ExeA
MTPAWLGYFGFKEAPFSKEVIDAELWLPSSKTALVDELCEALSDKASVSLVGEPGVGKTCVLRALRHRLPSAGFSLTYCHNATLGRRDFYRQLCLALGLTPSATAAAVFYAVTTHVEQLGQNRLHPVFLLDEAHLLQQDVIDHLHILLNYQWDSKSLLSLVLIGLPELEKRLSRVHHRSLFSRIHTRLRVDPLTPEDTAEYLRFRLAHVGCDKELFASDAIAMLHESANGAHRDIDRLATAALRETARKKRKLVEREVLSHIVDSDVAEPR